MAPMLPIARRAPAEPWPASNQLTGDLAPDQLDPLGRLEDAYLARGDVFRAGHLDEGRVPRET